MLNLCPCTFRKAKGRTLLWFGGSYHRQLRFLRFFKESMFAFSIKNLVDINRLIKVPSGVVFEKLLNQILHLTFLGLALYVVLNFEKHNH